MMMIMMIAITNDDHEVVDDDNDLFQEALINARERGFRISYSLTPC